MESLDEFSNSKSKNLIILLTYIFLFVASFAISTILSRRVVPWVEVQR